MAERLQPAEIRKFRPRRLSLFKSARSAELVRQTDDGPQSSGLVVLVEKRTVKEDLIGAIEQGVRPNYRILVVDKPKETNGKIEPGKRVFSTDIKAETIDEALRQGVEVFNRRDVSSTSVKAERRELVGAGAQRS